MMGWNYPPGVTGYEPEIAGYEEVNLIVDCDNEALETVSRDDVLSMVWDFEDIGAIPAEQIERLHTYYVPCEYSGYVTGYIVGAGVEWDCPRCGKTHTEEP